MGVSGADLDSDEARHRLYEVMSQDLEFQEKARQALELGKSYLGVENGHLTRIDTTANYWEVIESTDSSDGSFPPGLILDLKTTYCRRAVQQESMVSLHDAPNEGWGDDPAFESHELYCYHGVPIIAGDDIYGTVCFVSESPRTEPFTNDESMFAELIGHLLGHAIERKRHKLALTEREQIVGILCRVLRHNLQNDLTVVRGHAELIHNRGSSDEQVETILETIDELLELGNKTRRLSSLLVDSFDRFEHNLDSLIREVVTGVKETHPRTSITIEGTIGSSISVAPQIEIAFQEIIENAASHCGEHPEVGINLSQTQESIEIAVTDNGPGIPENECAVLEAGRETPLQHGRGLGLWMVYWIVARHDGDIDTTVTDAGSTVTVTLPRGPSKIPITDNSGK